MWLLIHKETTKAQGETAQVSQQKVLELFPSSLRADIWIHSVPYVVPILLPSRTFQDLSVLPLWFVIILWLSPLCNSLSIWWSCILLWESFFYFSTLKKKSPIVVNPYGALRDTPHSDLHDGDPRLEGCATRYPRGTGQKEGLWGGMLKEGCQEAAGAATSDVSFYRAALGSQGA